jgi:hypothetical protein
MSDYISESKRTNEQITAIVNNTNLKTEGLFTPENVKEIAEAITTSEEYVFVYIHAPRRSGKTTMAALLTAMIIEKFGKDAVCAVVQNQGFRSLMENSITDMVSAMKGKPGDKVKSLDTVVKSIDVLNAMLKDGKYLEHKMLIIDEYACMDELPDFITGLQKCDKFPKLLVLLSTRPSDNYLRLIGSSIPAPTETLEKYGGKAVDISVFCA